MARTTKADLEAHIEELKSCIAERDARLVKAEAAYRALRTENATLREQLADRAPVVFRRVGGEPPKPVITRFVRGSKLFEKTRVGNRSTERVVADVDENTALGRAFAAAGADT